MKNETPEQFVEAMSFANQSIPLSPTSEPNTCGNEYAALTGSPYAPRFKEQAYVAEINQLLARVAELEIQNLGLSEQAIKDRREAGELRARVAELEAQVAEIPDLLLIAHMQGAEQAKDQIQALRAQISALDCRLVGRVAELSGSHCPADKPCDRCVAERRIARLEALADACAGLIGNYGAGREQGISEIPSEVLGSILGAMIHISPGDKP